MLLWSGTNSSLFSKRSAYIDKKIKIIQFIGNKNTPTEDLEDMIQMKPGMILTEDLLNNDIKTLFNTGYFYFIDSQGELLGDEVKIVFELKERPRVREIEFVGADEIFPADVRDKMPIKENEVITPKKVNTSKELIMKKYRDEGFFLAYVKFEMGEIDPKTNTVAVKFIIDEGEDIPISKINIYGNEQLESQEILSVMDMKETGFIESGHFKESAFESDKQKILGLYKSKGFIDAELATEGTNWEIRWENPKKKNKRVVIVNVKVIEGEQYFFNGYSLDHDKTRLPDGNFPFYNKENNPSGTPLEKLTPVFNKDHFLKLFDYNDSDIGEIFDESKFYRDRSFINDQYSSKGYLFAQVIPKRRYIDLNETYLDQYENCSKKPQPEAEECERDRQELNISKLKKILKDKPDLRNKKFVHIDFNIRENNLAYIENILIKGNKKTQEKVIRREILVQPGELFNSTLVNRSRERIFNLGYFKEVNFNMRPGSDETKMNLIIDVTEQPTGNVSMGGGYGTISGFSIFSELGENNFGGTGQKINGRLEFGPIRKFMQISWTEPWIYDKPWALTLSMFYSSRTFNVGATQITENNNQAIKERATYDRNGFGFSVGVGHRFWINWTHFHRYSPSFYSSTKPSSLVSDQILAEVSLGWQFRSQISNGIQYDSRDNVFNPTTGGTALFSIDNVGQYMGGQSHFDQFRPLLEYYHTWFDYTLFGLFRNNQLRRWRVVQEFRTSSVFTFERTPKYGKQDKERIPYIQAQDRLFIGGYESLRGWFYDDKYFPNEWKDGGAHRVLWSSELRFPIEPSLLWFVVFLDAAAMYENVNKAVGERRDFFKAYDQTVFQQRLADPVNTFLLENYNSSGKRLPVSPLELNDPGNLVLSGRNIALDNFRYSWGFGLRIQIPVLPIRLYFAQKLRYTGEESVFGLYPDSRAFQFVFGIGDIRF